MEMIGVLFLLFPLWKIFERAGFHPMFSLVALIPFVGVLLVAAILAFAEWPSLELTTSSEGG